MKKLIVSAIVALLVVAALYRACDVVIYPIGGGRMQESPDGRLVAHALWMYDESFWGFTDTWYEFEVRSGGSDRVLARREVDVPPGQAVCRWRGGEGTIAWNADSSSVRFVADDGKVLCVLRVPPAP